MTGFNLLAFIFNFVRIIIVTQRCKEKRNTELKLNLQLSPSVLNSTIHFNVQKCDKVAKFLYTLEKVGGKQEIQCLLS